MSVYRIQCVSCSWTTERLDSESVQSAIADHEQQSHADLTPEKILRNLLRVIDKAPRTPAAWSRFVALVDEAAARAAHDLDDCDAASLEAWSDRNGLTIDKGVGDA